MEKRTNKQDQVLSVLNDVFAKSNGRPIGPTEISSLIGCSHSSVSYELRLLENQGFVKRIQVGKRNGKYLPV